jgi:DNA-binding winged helix-turn-helix (wHTH) protein/TolB-like protein/tetratricopeptide (TPR) repeat protein
MSLTKPKFIQNGAEPPLEPEPTPHDHRKRYSFGPFQLDPQQRLLTFEGRPEHLPPRTFDLLLYLLERNNEVVDKNVLMNEVWRDTFVEDANLTVHISRIRKLLQHDARNTATIQTFPKTGYRFVAPVEVLGYGTEISANETARDAKAEQRGLQRDVKARTRPSRLSIAAVGGTALLLFLAFGSVRLFTAERAPVTVNVGSIAVLPIKNETGDDSLEFLADGITEDVIRSLSHVPNILIKPRSTVQHYKDKDMDPVGAGKELSVDAVLTGKMTKGTRGVVISYELLKTDSGDIIVSDRIERDIENAASIYFSIADTVEGKLGHSETKIPRPPIKGDAYEFYLRGRYALERRTIPELKNAARFFEKSIDADPGLALAYSGVADSYALMADYGALSRADSIPKAKAAALRAIELDPDLAEAHASLGAIIADNEGDAAAAEREFLRALELDPNYAAAHQWYAELLSNVGRFEEAKAAIHRAEQLDPLSRIIRTIDARISMYSGNADEAIAIAMKNIDLDPKWGGDHDLLFPAYEAKGMYGEAAEAHLASIELLKAASEEEIRASRDALIKGGWNAFVKHRLSSYEARARKEYVRPLILAEWNARLGNMDAAFQQVNEAIGQGSVSLGGAVRFLPAFEKFRRDPRYRDLALRFNTSSN